MEGEFDDVERKIVRGADCRGKPRIDGRDTRTVRPINVQVGVLPRTHGSAVFTRGETQALVVTTLGTGRDAQIIDALEGEQRDPFMLHYNFPPYSSARRASSAHRSVAKSAMAGLPGAASRP